MNMRLALSFDYMCIQYFLTVGICIGLGLMMKMIAPRIPKLLSGEEVKRCGQ